MEHYVSYGHGHSKFSITERLKTLTLLPKEIASLDHMYEKVIESILNSEGYLKLQNVANKESSIVIIIDDNTRPIPTKEIIIPLLDYLNKLHVKKEKIKIIIALGAHKKLNEKAIIGLVGEKIYGEYKVVNHDAFDNNQLTYFGETSFGTPIWINNEVVNADIKILIGLIKPHNQAGYSGGGKSILPGVAGIKTIQSNHNYKSISNQDSRIGIINGNPIRSDIEDSLKFIDNVFIINVVMDYKENVIDIVSGDPIEAHKKGAKILDEVSKFEINSDFDICICGTPDPIDIDFYQMLNSLSLPYRCNQPIIKEGGAIIVVGRAYQGISTHDFYKCLAKYSPDTVWDKISHENSDIEDRAALQIFLEGFLKYNIIVATELKNINYFNDMKIEAYYDIQNAVDSVIKKYKNPNILILPYAPYTIIKKV
ncbi:MAG: nickel-dependent lactate racemase [Eubacteriales bacterium]